MNIGGAFVIKDIAVVDGQKGMFARMPFRSYKGANGETKYSDIAFALTDEARQIYGYLWNETRDQWLVDEYSAEVVKRTSISLGVSSLRSLRK